MEENEPGRPGGAMVPAHFSDADLRTVRECLQAAAHGPFFPDWEFHTLFGLTRGQFVDVAESWPNLDFTDRNSRLALNNAVGNLLGYPHGRERQWPDFISLTPEELGRWWDTWRWHFGVEVLE